MFSDPLDSLRSEESLSTLADEKNLTEEDGSNSSMLNFAWLNIGKFVFTFGKSRRVLPTLS